MMPIFSTYFERIRARWGGSKASYIDALETPACLFWRLQTRSHLAFQSFRVA